MTCRQAASHETIAAIRKKIVYYDNQKHLADQELSIVKNQLEDIDHFFCYYGHDNEFNVVTQTTANERVKIEGRFDKIMSDIYHFNKKLVALNNDLHAIYKNEFDESK